MNTLFPSLIRTYVPIVVGALVAWLVSLGVVVDETLQAGLIAVLTGLLIAVYYTLVRLLERKWPALSVLLGSSTLPATYTSTGQPAPPPLAAPDTGP